MSAQRLYLAVAYAEPDGTRHEVGEEARFPDTDEGRAAREARLRDGTVTTRKPAKG